jgi:Carboxypeptidase regulatory-like domain
MKIAKLKAGLLAAIPVAMFALSAQSYEVTSVTGGGTIEGKIVFHGKVPTRKIIPSKDVGVCGEPREDPLIEAGPDGGVQDAVVYLAEIEKGKAWPPPGKPPELDNLHCRFVPEVQVIHTGPLVVVNSDPVLHNARGYYERRPLFNVALPNEGQRIPTEVPRPGVVRVECNEHGWMLGWIYAVANPYYAITDADGKFAIGDVPPGDYTLVIWQAYTGETKRKVTITAGKTTELDLEITGAGELKTR